MKVPGWCTLKNVLISIISIVGIFILILATLSAGENNRFSFTPRKNEVRRLLQQCKQMKRIESVNWNYFYYYEDLTTKKSLVWCKVPKAGSTTLTKMFLRLAGAKKSQNETRIHKLLRDFYPRLPAKVMKHRMRMSKTFLVVRDPFERILSAYRDKLENYERDLEYRDGYYHDHYGKFMVKPSTSSSSGNSSKIHNNRKEPTWKEFVQYLLKTSVARFDEHWMPITKLCSPCSVGFDSIIKMENFEKDIQKTLHHAGINTDNLGWSHKTGTANRKLINSYFKNLTLSDVKKLYGKYKKDFQLFGYTPYKYFRLFNEAGGSSVAVGTNKNNNSKVKKVKKQTV